MTLTLYQIEAQLRDALARPLPGPIAHRAVAPRPRRGWQPGEIPDGSRAAAGLLLIYPVDERPHVVLTVRAGGLLKHAGQVSLPGGAVDPDERIEDAALREGSEEIGLATSGVRVLGTLSALHIPVSSFVLHPVVAVRHTRPALRAAAGEVARILEVPFEALQDASRLRRGRRYHDDAWDVLVPYFELGGERVWGATAMVLAELLAVLGVPPRDPWEDGENRL